jgi:CHAD domain-containing protein
VAVDVRTRNSAVEALQTMLGAQLDELRRLGPRVLASDDDDAVHDMRVAVRRARSVLRTTRRLLEATWVQAVRTELAWIGGELGAVRDLDVLSERLAADARTLSGGDAAVSGTLLRPLSAEHASRRAHLLESLQSRRYERLLETLAAGVAEPPIRNRDVPVQNVAAREFKKLRKKGRLTHGLSNAALHKRRIRVKRARYAAELAAAARGDKANSFIAAAKLVQDVLGEHQDAVVARRKLRQLARSARQRDASLVAGRLIERQEQRMRTAREELPAAWKRLEKRGRRAW